MQRVAATYIHTGHEHLSFGHLIRYNLEKEFSLGQKICS